MGGERIDFSGERETLLITVASKAAESAQANPILVDPTAQRILERADYDFKSLKVPRKSSVMVAMRAKKLDDLVRHHLATSTKPLVINLGCGLDGRFERLGSPECPWYDLDFPDVVALRPTFFDEPAHYHRIGSSVTDLRWLEEVPVGFEVLVIAEGLLMYLEESDVMALTQGLRERFPGCTFAFDAFSVLTAKSAKAHPSVRKTGARFRWGIDDAKDLESWAEGIRVREEWFFSQSEDLDKLGGGMRLMFRMAGAFAAANRAHRILVLQLNGE